MMSQQSSTTSLLSLLNTTFYQKHALYDLSIIHLPF